MDHQHSDSPDPGPAQGWWQAYDSPPESTGVVREVMDRFQAGMDTAERHEDGAALYAALDVVLDLLGDEHGDPLTTPVVAAVATALRTSRPLGRGSQDVVSHGNC